MPVIFPKDCGKRDFQFTYDACRRAWQNGAWQNGLFNNDNRLINAIWKAGICPCIDDVAWRRAPNPLKVINPHHMAQTVIIYDVRQDCRFTADPNW